MKIEAKASALYIGANDARMVSGSLRKAKAAIEATAAKAAVPAVKDKEGNVTAKAKPAVEAKPAQPAQPAVQFIKISCKNQTVMDEVLNRMAISKVAPKAGDEPKATAEGVMISFQSANQAIFRQAFKKCKGSGEHNAAGKKVIDADKKAKDKIASDKKKVEEAAKAKKEGAGKKAPAKAGAKTGGKKSGKPIPSSKEDGWDE